MLLTAVIILMSLLFVFSVRKHKNILSVLVAIETVVLISMLAVTYLSAAGNGTVIVFILSRAILSKISLFGLSVSSIMLIQALVVLLACFILFYSVFRIVQKVCRKNNGYMRKNPDKKEGIFQSRNFITRKVFMLYCRMNN